MIIQKYGILFKHLMVSNLFHKIRYEKMFGVPCLQISTTVYNNKFLCKYIVINCR